MSTGSPRPPCCTCRGAKGLQHDAIVAVELALTQAGRLAEQPLVDLAERDERGNVVPLITIPTDNGGPFRSFGFEAFIAPTPSCSTCARA
jgi:hypothetical protein